MCIHNYERCGDNDYLWRMIAIDIRSIGNITFDGKRFTVAEMIRIADDTGKLFYIGGDEEKEFVPPLQLTQKHGEKKYELFDILKLTVAEKKDFMDLLKKMKTEL